MQRMIFILIAVLCLFASACRQAPGTAGTRPVANAEIRDRNYLIIKFEGISLYPALPEKGRLKPQPAGTTPLPRRIIVKIKELMITGKPGSKEAAVWYRVEQVTLPQRIAAALSTDLVLPFWEKWLTYCSAKQSNSVSDKSVAAFLQQYPDASSFNLQETADFIVVLEYYLNRMRINMFNIAKEQMAINLENFRRTQQAITPVSGWITKSEVIF